MASDSLPALAKRISSASGVLLQRKNDRRVASSESVTRCSGFASSAPARTRYRNFGEANTDANTSTIASWKSEHCGRSLAYSASFWLTSASLAGRRHTRAINRPNTSRA